MRRFLFGLAVLVLVAHGSNWEIEAVYSDPGSYIWAAIATDTACRPHLVYAASGEKTVRYAVRGDSWKTAVVQTGRAVYELNLSLDSEVVPHVGYIEGRHTSPYLDSVRYARFDGDTWHFETVTGPGRHGALSMALARDNTPQMMFQDSATVKYAYKTGDTWNILTVPTEQADTLRRLISASLALDTTGRPGIAVTWTKQEALNRDSIWLAIFEYDGRDWHRFEADSGQGWGVYDFWRPRIQCDPATNLFHITYRYGRYVTGRGHNWQAEWAGLSVGDWWYDFALHQGRPHIVCAGWTPSLLYQWRRTGGWEEEWIRPGDMRGDPSIAVDQEGIPHVAFVGGHNTDTLFYARRLFVGIQEPARPAGPTPVARTPTLVRGVLSLPQFLESPRSLFATSGRRVMGLNPGKNDVRHLSPGVYFVRSESSTIPARKVVVQR